jgi:hypothetical protein
VTFRKILRSLLADAHAVLRIHNAIMLGFYFGN